MRAPPIKDETQVARELQAKRQQREAEVVPVSDACEGVKSAWFALQKSIQAAVHRHDQLREQNAILRRKLRNLRKSNARLQKAHTLTVRHLTPQARMLVRSLSPAMMDTVRLLLGRVSEEELRALAAGKATVHWIEYPQPAAGTVVNDPPAPSVPRRDFEPDETPNPMHIT